jgi:predicted ATPase
MSASRRHILTGAPGTGKTAVLGHMPSEIAVVAEPAREILAEERAAGRPIGFDGDEDRFVDLLLRRSIEKFEAASPFGGTALFDRGIPDCIAYAVHLGADPEPSRRAAAAHRFDDPVLLLTPWEEIYRTDDERRMTFEDVVAFHRAIMDAYRAAGYEPIELPRAPAGDRAAFVLELIRA